jgi:hypothetical protein
MSMIIMQAPSGASEALRHAVELVNRDLDGILAKLDTGEQNRLWEEWRLFSTTQIEGRGREAQLIVGAEIPEGVRESLRDLDARVAQHLHSLNRGDRRQFWMLMRGAAEEQAEPAKQPKARFGGGSQAG